MPESTSTAPDRALAIVNARVWTGDARRPWADAVLVRGDRIVGIGSSPEIRKRAGGGARVFDAKGMAVVPRAADGRIAAGSPADLLVVERTTHGGATPPGPEEIVLALEQGVVVVDRDATIT